MKVVEAQREVRTVFIGGFPGQLVSGVLWLLSAATSTWVSHRQGIIVLVVGGAFIFPATVLLLRAMRRRAALGARNPMGQLAMQVAFTIPLNLPLVGATTLYRHDWFYPASMIVVGTHYLPFAFLYGMRQFIVLAALMVAGGLGLGVVVPMGFSAGGWFTGAVLLMFAVAGRMIARRDERAAPLPAG